MVNVDIEKVVLANLPQFKQILGMLEQKYQHPVVEPNRSIEQIMYDAGQYSVLTHLRTVVEQAEANALAAQVIQDSQFKSPR